MDKITVSSRIVNQYITTARRNAESIVEKMAVTEAVSLNRSKPHINLESATLELATDQSFRDKGHRDTVGSRKLHKRAVSPESAEVVSWKILIIKQIHLAICTRSKKYAKEVASLKRNARLLIGAIAGYVAASVGVAVAVIAALVAAILRLVLAMGLAAFCERHNLRN